MSLSASPRDAIRRDGEDPSFKVERRLTRIRAGEYQGRGRAYGLVVYEPDDECGWKIEPHWGEDRAKTLYADWLLSRYLGLRGPHATLREARNMLIDALKADLRGEVRDDVRPAHRPSSPV